MPAAKTRPLHQIYQSLFRRYGPQGWWPGDTALEIIVGAILTQNTAWTNVEKAIASMKRRKLLSWRGVSDVAEEDLADVVRPSGFFNVKARRLLNFVRHVNKHHGGSLRRFLSLPAGQLRQELLSVNGIGAETADSIVLYAAGKPSFVVDAYTRRILSRMGLIEGSADYARIQRLFEDSMPRSARIYNEYHALIVRHAKEHCRTKPRCGRCVLARFCPKKGTHYETN